MSRRILLVLAAVHASGALAQSTGGSGWDDGTVLGRFVTRLAGYPIVSALCAVSNCDKPQALPERPGGRYAAFGPLKTELVYLDERVTRGYGFPGAVVACPVVPERGSASDEARRLLGEATVPTVPGVVWSYGGNGNCDGTGGFANVADGFPGLYGEPGRGYWLPELLEHMASHGIVAVCPYLAGVPDAAGPDAGVNAARMLAEVQPCQSARGARVNGGALGIAGYSLGAGRAVRGASNPAGRDVIKAVVAMHTWDGGALTSVPSPLMLLSATVGLVLRKSALSLRNYRVSSIPVRAARR